MLATPAEIEANPHCAQCLNDEHRKCHTGLGFRAVLPMGEGNAPDEEYVELKHCEASVLHWGQLKLLLGEIQFLTPYLHVPNLCVVYVGSAPGHHIKVLVDIMPPTWTWELYDDRPCEVFCECQLSDIIYEKVTTKKQEAKVEPITVPPELEPYHILLKNSKFTAAFRQLKSMEGDQQRKALAILQHELMLVKLQELSERKTEQEALVQRLTFNEAPQACILRNTLILQQITNTIPVAREFRPNVKVHNQCMDITEARRLRAEYVTHIQSEVNPQLLCISDLRTPHLHITETTVQYDMMLQQGLINVMRPYQSSLKFKMPYSDSFSQDHIFIDGNLFLQAYTPRVSHETRLVTRCGDIFMKSYNKDEYAKRMYYFQSKMRTSLYDVGEALPNGEEHPTLLSKGVGIDYCYDCTAARRVMRCFVEARGGGDYLAELENRVQQLSLVQASCKADGGVALDE